MAWSELLHMTFLFLIVLDPPGNIPIFVSLLHHYPLKRQRAIIWREMLIALAVMIFFFFFGESFSTLLHIDACSMQIAGGIILFLIALRLLFSIPKHIKMTKLPKEPFIVPLAVPMVAGPGILATISLHSGGVASNNLLVFIAILLSWTLMLPFVFLSSFLKRVLGENGVAAIEQLFGYLIALVAIQMVVGGLYCTIRPLA